MDTPTTEDLDKAYTAKQAALLDYRNSRGEAHPTRQQWLDRYVIAVSAYERIRAQTSDKWLAKNPEMDAANDNLEADMVNNPHITQMGNRVH